MPTVSVVMGVYNGERYLHQAVESILVQTLTDLEFIVLDDGSTDRTLSILESFQDARLIVVRLPHFGHTRTLNVGIRMAQSPYIARMDADDIALETRLQKQVEFLDSHPEVGVLGSSCYWIDDKGQILNQFIVPQDDRSIRNVLIRHNPFSHPSVMIRKVAVEEAGYYDETLQASGDYDLWFRIARRYQLANMAEPLMMFRLHAQKVTLRKQRLQLRTGLRVRFRAIREGMYPPYYIIYLIPFALLWLMPSPVSRLFRLIQWRVRTSRDIIVMD